MNEKMLDQAQEHFRRSDALWRKAWALDAQATEIELKAKEQWDEGRKWWHMGLGVTPEEIQKCNKIPQQWVEERLGVASKYDWEYHSSK